MKFRFAVVITLPDELFPPSPIAHPDDSPERMYKAMAEGLRRAIPSAGVLPCVGGGTRWDVKPAPRSWFRFFDEMPYHLGAWTLFVLALGCALCEGMR